MITTKRNDVAFYNNRGAFEVDRRIDFEPAELEKKWVDLEHVLVGTEVDLDAYRNLCRTAVGITTRIIFLAKEHCVYRAIGTNGEFKPTGGVVQFSGRNFTGSVSMDFIDCTEHGLKSMGTDRELFELGGHASVDGQLTVDDRYYSTSIGKNVCLVDRGSEYPTQVASPDFIQAWTDKVLQPLEFDIKSGAYVWTGSPKTDLSSPHRLVSFG